MTLREKTFHIDSLGGRTVTARVLWVSEVDTLVETLRAGKLNPTVALVLFHSDLPIEAVSMSTGISAEELLGKVYPDELEKIWRAVEEVNPILAGLIATKTDQTAPSIPEPSNASPAGSSGTDTPVPTTTPGTSSLPQSTNSVTHCVNDDSQNQAEGGEQSQDQTGPAQEHAGNPDADDANRGQQDQGHEDGLAGDQPKTEQADSGQEH